MSKQIWVVFIILIALVLILSSATSFLYFKNKSNLKSDNITSSPSSEVEEESTPEEKSSSTASPQATAVAKISNSQKPSIPDNYYTVQSGETLFVVATKNNLTWTEVAEANGITNADKILAGQNLIIPSDEGVLFELNTEKAASLQKSVDRGSYAFRLDPIQTAQSDVSPVYGLTKDDTFTLVKNENGTATVKAKHDDKSYNIFLNQPETKGEKGIWAITKVTLIV